MLAIKVVNFPEPNQENCRRNRVWPDEHSGRDASLSLHEIRDIHCGHTKSCPIQVCPFVFHWRGIVRTKQAQQDIRRLCFLACDHPVHGAGEQLELIRYRVTTIAEGYKIEAGCG